MILFAEDWAKYPTAKPNLLTTNKSFVRLATVFRTMGVKNHAFILALVDQSLVGVDPFDPNLSMETMAAIAVECKINPWFYFREIARAPGLAGEDARPIEANRGNICLWWCFFNHVMIMLIQIRQTGKSFSSDSLDVYLMNIAALNTTINLLTKDDKLRRENIASLKEITEALPFYLQQRTREDSNNTEELTVKKLGNKYLTHVPQASPRAAYNLGRGLKSPILKCDEGPFQVNIKISLGAALAAGGAVIDAAIRAGTHYGTVLTTTAGKIDDPSGGYIYGLLEEAAVWTEMFYDTQNVEDLTAMVRRHSRGGVVRVNATFNHRQLGKTDAWLKQKLEENLQTADDANRDFFNMWTSGSLTSPLSTDVLKTMRDSVVGEMYTAISKPHGYITRWYVTEGELEDRMNNCKVILGVDTSEASGGDDISLVYLDSETLDVLAVGNYNETNLITFAEYVCNILVAYPNITAIIERRSTGGMLLDYLLLMLPALGIDPFKRLFNWVVQDYDEQPERWKEIQIPMGRRNQDIYVRFKKLFGWATSAGGATSRSELYSTTLQNAAKRGGGKLRDKSLVDQTAGLVTRNGRIDHPVGKHDDLVIGWLLGNWLLTQGKNLVHYGIDIKRVMSAIEIKQAESIQEMNLRLDQEYVRERIEDIYSQLTKEADDWVTQRLEFELRSLDKKIILESGEKYSLDELIHDAREMRRQRKATVTNNSYEKQYRNVIYEPAGRFSDKPLTADEMNPYLR